MDNQIPLFQKLAPEHLKLLDPYLEYFTCPPETVIFKQGSKPLYLYLLLKGKVAIHYKPYDGTPITLTHVRAGEVFGWSAVIGSKRYTSSGISKTQVEAVRIRGKHLWKLAHENPEAGQIILEKLANIVSSRWPNAQDQVHELFKKAMEEDRKNRGI